MLPLSSKPAPSLAAKEKAKPEPTRAEASELTASSVPLPPVTRRVLERIVEAVKAQRLPRESVRFSRREVREWTGASDTQARAHLERLVGLEYLLTHRGQRGQSFEYELIYDGDGSGAGHLSGLLDMTTIASSRGRDGEFAGSTRVPNGPNAAPSRGEEKPAGAGERRLSEKMGMTSGKTHVLAEKSVRSS